MSGQIPTIGNYSAGTRAGIQPASELIHPSYAWALILGLCLDRRYKVRAAARRC